MQVWGAHAGMGSSCRYGELLQVCGARSCRYGELMQVWGAHAGMGSSCRYVELDHAGMGSCMSCSKGLDVLGEILRSMRLMGYWCLLFVMFRVHVYLKRLSLSVNYYKVEIFTLIIDTKSSAMVQ